MTSLRLLATLALAATCALPGRAAPSQSDLGLLLDRVAERVARYYHRAQSLVCLETATVQPINRDWTWNGLPRTVESELRLESESADGMPLPEARLVREVRRVNGREPRQRDNDKKSRAGCTDPDPFSPEPLSFLLPAHREDYRFTSVHEARERNRAALVVEFESANRKSKVELIRDKQGRDDCFASDGTFASRGRVWVDAVTYEVLRVDERIEGPVELRVSLPLQRQNGFDRWVILDRRDETMRYKEIGFSNPDEILLLPESIETTTIWRGDLQSTRRTSTYRDYQRFLTASRVRVKGSGG